MCICLSETNCDSCCFSTFFSGNNKDIWYGWCCSHISWCSVKILPNICLNHLLWFRIISVERTCSSEFKQITKSSQINCLFPTAFTSFSRHETVSTCSFGADILAWNQSVSSSIRYWHLAPNKRTKRINETELLTQYLPIIWQLVGCFSPNHFYKFGTSHIHLIYGPFR